MRKTAVVSLIVLASAVATTAASAQSGRYDSGRPEANRYEPSRQGRQEPGRYGWRGDATNTPFIDANQDEQRARIEQGRRSGQLTRSEYHQLMDEQDRIEAMERRAKADGFADPIERQRIRDAQQAAGRHIQQETHDNETRRNRWYRRWW